MFKYAIPKEWLVLGCIILAIIGVIVWGLFQPTQYVDDWATSQPFEWDESALSIQDRYQRADKLDEFLPSARKTPGAIWRQVTLEQIKRSGYSATVRDVPESLKKQVVERYGNPNDVGEIDHLVPLSIGGSNAQENLWPQPAKGEWNYKVKDTLEKKLLKGIRDGDLDLKETQKAVATDWIALYKKLVGPEPKESISERDEQ